MKTVEEAKALPVSNTNSVPTKRKQGDSEPEDVLGHWQMIVMGFRPEGNWQWKH